MTDYLTCHVCKEKHDVEAKPFYKQPKGHICGECLSKDLAEAGLIVVNGIAYLKDENGEYPEHVNKEREEIRKRMKIASKKLREEFQ